MLQMGQPLPPARPGGDLISRWEVWAFFFSPWPEDSAQISGIEKSVPALQTGLQLHKEEWLTNRRQGAQQAGSVTLPLQISMSGDVPYVTERWKTSFCPIVLMFLSLVYL